MSSQAITENDLRAILNEVLPAKSGNAWANYGHWSSNITTTSRYEIMSTEYVSSTGRVLISGFANRLYTSTKTSGLTLLVGDTYSAQGSANNVNNSAGSSVYITDIHTVPIGESIHIGLILYSQDTSTTATIPAFNSYGLAIRDV